MENGQPRITPTAATEIAMAGFSRRNNPDERLIAYIENELGRKPGSSLKTKILRKSRGRIDGTTINIGK